MKRKKYYRIITLFLASILLIMQCITDKKVYASSSSKDKVVYFKLPEEWTGRVDATSGQEILPGVYVAGGQDGEYVPWVGEHMTKVEGTEDIYSYKIPGDQTLIIFNTGMQRDWQTGEIAISGDNMIYIIDSDVETKNAQGHWEPYNTEDPKVAINSGTFNFVGSKKLVLSRFNSESGTYQINNGEKIPFNNGDEIEIGKEFEPKSEINLTLNAVNGTKETSYEYTFTKSNSLKVYAKNNCGWDKMYVHYWGGESASVFPGIEMTLMEDSSDIYYAEIPSKTTNYKFNNALVNTDQLEQSSNLATQDIVEGVSECYIVNYLNSGETANTGSYTTLEKALQNEPEAGKPTIRIESVEAKLNENVNINVSLENVEKMSGYVATLTYDGTVLEPVSDEFSNTLTVNNTKNGELILVYANANALDFTEKETMVTIPFKVIANQAAQTKISVKSISMYADEVNEVSFKSSNLVYGKATVGVNKETLKTKIDYINGLNENDYTPLTYQNAISAKNNATLILNAIDATQEKVDAQVKLLDDAISNLVSSNENSDYFYFKNTTEWEEVYAYWWGGETVCPAFPGIKASKVEGTTDIYCVALPSDATGINFNNGSNEDGNKEQTDSITGENLAPNNMFVPNLEDTYEKNNGIRYRGSIENYIPNTIYFLNNAKWQDVYVYWWGGTNACPAFPGVKAKLVNGTTNVYKATLPEDATGYNFNNGKQGTDGGEQTSSMSVIERGKILVMDLDSKYEKNGGYRYNAVYDELEKYLKNNDYIYFRNNVNWETVNAYYWGGDDTILWSGKTMKLVEGTSDVYYIKAINATKIIFNNGGNGEQTIDIDLELNKIYEIDLTTGEADKKQFSGEWKEYNGPIPSDGEEEEEETTTTDQTTTKPETETTTTDKVTDATTKHEENNDESINNNNGQTESYSEKVTIISENVDNNTTIQTNSGKINSNENSSTNTGDHLEVISVLLMLCVGSMIVAISLKKKGDNVNEKKN